MRSRRIGWLAWSPWGLTMVLEVAAIWLWLGARSRGGGYFTPQVFIVPGFATVGAVIAAHRANTVGWLFVGLGFVAALQAFSMAYGAKDRLIGLGTLPAISVIGPLEGWLWPLNYTLFFLIMLLFPDGRLPSPRWRPAARFLLVAWTLSILLNTLGPSEGNPLSVPALLEPAWATAGPGREHRRAGRYWGRGPGPLPALSPSRLSAAPAAQMGGAPRHRRCCGR